MPIQFNEENSGKVLAVHVSGKLTNADYEHFVPVLERLIRQNGKHHAMAVFCKPFTKATIRYFDHTDAAVAREWLGES